MPASDAKWILVLGAITGVAIALQSLLTYRLRAARFEASSGAPLKSGDQGARGFPDPLSFGIDRPSCALNNSSCFSARTLRPRRCTSRYLVISRPKSCRIDGHGRANGGYRAARSRRFAPSIDNSSDQWIPNTQQTDAQRAVIIGAGRGSRLGHHTEDRPKCLLDGLGGKRLLDWLLDAYRQLASGTSASSRAIGRR